MIHLWKNSITSYAIGMCLLNWRIGSFVSHNLSVIVNGIACKEMCNNSVFIFISYGYLLIRNDIYMFTTGMLNCMAWFQHGFWFLVFHTKIETYFLKFFTCENISSYGSEMGRVNRLHGYKC